MVGDLEATIQIGLFSFPSRKVPDGIPLAPLKLQDSSPASLDAQLPPSPLTDPSMAEPDGGYWISICNTSKTHAHSLGYVSVQIASFTAYGGQLNAWDAADSAYADSAYTQCGSIYRRPQGVSGGGCSVDGLVIACMHATFPTGGGVGSSVSAAFNANPGCRTGATLPLSLPPGQELDFALGMTPPSTPGTFTFTMHLGTDAGAITFAPSAPVLLAPVAHHWTGEACTTSTMQAQIPPATNPSTVYICPA
jgi:hypothetical protein